MRELYAQLPTFSLPMLRLTLSLKGAQELAALQPPVDTSSSPRSHPGRYICLASSGRRLGYEEYVDTSVAPERLRNVVLLPGIPGTRLFTHPDVQRCGFVPCWRLIVLERPGIGLSDPAPPQYTYSNFAADFREFCAMLDLADVTVIGFSAGTPFATAIACVQPPPPLPPPPPPPIVAANRNSGGNGDASAPKFCDKSPAAAALASSPQQASHTPVAVAAAHAGAGAAGDAAVVDRVVLSSGMSPRPPAHTGTAGAAACTALAVSIRGVALVSTIGPPDTPNKRQGMALTFQFAYWACTFAPWLVGWAVRSQAAAFRRRPLHTLRRAFRLYDGKADVEALKNPEVERLFLESALELYGRDQEDAVLRENLLFAGQPWGFDLAGCRTPVAIWQGAQDRGCTPAMATHLAERLGSAARVRVVPELGHMLYFDVWQQVVDWVNSLGTGEGAGCVAPPPVGGEGGSA